MKALRVTEMGHGDVTPSEVTAVMIGQDGRRPSFAG